MYILFIVVYSKTLLYVFFILSCTTFQFGFVCNLFGLLFCSDINHHNHHQTAIPPTPIQQCQQQHNQETRNESPEVLGDKREIIRPYEDDWGRSGILPSSSTEASSERDYNHKYGYHHHDYQQIHGQYHSHHHQQ